MAAAAHAEASAGVDSAAAHAWHMGQLVQSWTHNVVDLQQRMTIAEERLRLAEARIAGTADTVSKMDPAALRAAIWVSGYRGAWCPSSTPPFSAWISAV